MMLIPLFRYGKKCYTLKGLFYPIALLEHLTYATKQLAVAVITYYLLILCIQPGILFFDLTDMDYAMGRQYSWSIQP